MNDDVAQRSHHSAVSRSGRAERFHQDVLPRDALPRLTPGVGFIATLLLSIGLWGAVWLAISALATVRPGWRSSNFAGRNSQLHETACQYEGGPNAVAFE